MHLRHRLHVLRSGVRYCQVWRRYLGYGSPPSRPDRQEYFHQALRESAKARILITAVDIVPVIMAGIIAIYGLVVSVLISSDLKQDLPLYTGFIQLGAGLSVGLAGLAAG